jgi:hypothetical protein
MRGSCCDSIPGLRVARAAEAESGEESSSLRHTSEEVLGMSSVYARLRCYNDAFAHCAAGCKDAHSVTNAVRVGRAVGFIGASVVLEADTRTSGIQAAHALPIR